MLVGVIFFLSFFVGVLEGLSVTCSLRLAGGVVKDPAETLV